MVATDENAGFGAGCHAGARASDAPLLLFLNPDAELAPGCLEALRAAAHEQPGWGAWQALVMLPGGQLQHVAAASCTTWVRLGRRQCDEPVAAVPDGPREIAFPSGAALMVRREAWDAAGGLEPAFFMYSEDVDLWLRLWLAGWGVGVVPAARV